MINDDVAGITADRIAVRAPKGIPAKMVATYLERCIHAVPTARTALEAGDFAQIRVWAHRLKGSGGGYGVPALTEYAALLEKAAIQGDETGVGDQLGILETYLRRLDIQPD